ncbi:metallophosphoesterase [Levilactobacillus enshiensis]|uniref:metallophosphoesterase n=1 Tax=Levilactobacillus enshiensis TaxID=2590213 RepID=UPI00117AF6AB|nr:metallophosphoesterase [Levilactobacillus enshiensis]
MGDEKSTNGKIIYAYLGLPGAESWLRAHGLEKQVISEQRLRLAVGNPQLLLNEEGQLTTSVNPSIVPLVDRILAELLRKRFDSAETVILAVNLLSKSRLHLFRRLLADAWGYKVVFVNAMDLPIKPADAIAMGYDDGVRQRWSRYLARYTAVDWSTMGTVIGLDKFLQDLQQPLQFRKVSATTKRLVVFSDVHGDADNLQSRLSKLASSQTEVVFLGDAIDRGRDSAGVIRTLQAYNTGLHLLGNHEHRLLTWYLEHRLSRSATKDFGQVTLPQLERAHVSQDEIHQFINGLGTYLALKFAGRKFLFSHAGLEPTQVMSWLKPKTLTESIALAPADVFIHGLSVAGKSVYSRDIDKVWADAKAVRDIISVHGHRNRFDRDVVTNQGMSFNLTDADGSSFRYLVLTAEDRRFALHIDQRNGEQKRVITGVF